MSTLLRLPPIYLSVFAAYGLFQSYQAIVRLQQYEEKTKTAAKYSNTAADELHKTRTTQGSAAVSILLSFLSSTALIFTSPSPGTAALTSTACVAVTLAARVHVKNFWDNKAKVPFVEGYNEAISGTAELVKALGWLGAAWGLEVVLAGAMYLGSRRL